MCPNLVKLPAPGSLSVYYVTERRLPTRVVNANWDQACKFWSIYGYPKPRVNRSILDARGSSHEEEIAFLNFADKRVTVNLHRLERFGLDLLPSIFIHELGHKFCPGDLKTLLLINSAVKQIIEVDQSAAIIGNLYRDMLVNTEAHRRGDRGIYEFYSRAWKDNPDNIQQIIGRAYEKLFQRQDTSRRYAGTIIRTQPSPEIESAADKVASIIRRSARSNWLKSAREFAAVLKEHVPSMNAEALYVISNVSAADFSPEGRSPIPPQGRSDVKQLERRLGGVVFELRQLEGGEDRKPCSFGTFKNFLESSRIQVAEEEALIWYYRSLIGGKVVKVPEVSVASGSLYPYAPRTWRIGDPPSQLDIVLSRSIGGVLIPGVTTKKWEMRRGNHLSVGRDYPDLDLWIDSSGSMVDPAQGISHAVVAGMIVSKSFLATRKAVRVVNFSGTMDGGVMFESTGGFIREEEEVDRRLVRFIGQWTVLPLDEIEKPYQAGGKQKYIVVITDLDIQNITGNTIARLRKVFRQSVGGTVFLIGPGKEDVRKIFEDVGFDVVPVTSAADLDQHALKLTKKLFEERLAYEH